MDAAKDPFAELGLTLTATDKEVREAWRKCAFERHPDRNPGNPNAEQRFSRAQAAYERLKNPEMRALEAKIVRNNAGAKSRVPQAAAFDDFYRAVDSAAAPWTRAAAGVAPTAGSDIRRSLTLTLEQAFKGGRFAIEHVSAACARCEGSGRESFPGGATCPQCLGEGTLRASEGMVRLKMACACCSGRKRVPWVVCSGCGGSGQVRAVSADIAVPPGAAAGFQVVKKGLGQHGTGGGGPGNLVVDVKIREHPVFGRNGADLTHKISIPVWDAALGCRKPVRGIDGIMLDVGVPPGCRSGQTVTVTGAGMPSGEGRGDLKILVDVAIPKAVDGPLRDMFMRMRQEMSR